MASSQSFTRPSGDVVPLSKLTPQNLEAERAILASILMDNHAINTCVEHLSAEDFYREAHQVIFQAMMDLSSRNEPCDLITVSSELESKAQLERIGGVSYLSVLVDNTPSAANVASYAKLVREKSLARRLLSAATDIIGDCYQEADVDTLIDSAESRIFAVSERKSKTTIAAVRDLVKAGYKRIEELYENRGQLTGLSTGFADLDKSLHGLQKGDFIIVAGRPSMGKTAFALNLVENAARHCNARVAVFSLEMGKEQLVMRMLTSQARIDASTVRRGELSESDWPRLLEACDTIGQMQVFIDDLPAQSTHEIRAKCRRIAKEHGLDMVVVDYLQLMRGGGNSNSREQEISEISRSLKALAKELNVPVVALSQLNRSLESRVNKRPMMSDLRECVTGDTLVCLTDGRRVPICELVGQEPTVWALDEKQKIVAAPSDRVWSVGKRPILRLSLGSGRTLHVTAKHRLYGWQGWVRAGELKIGDRLALARKIPEPVQTKTWMESEIILLGHLVGGGSFLKQQPMRYSTASEENSLAVTEAARAMGSHVKRYVGRGKWHQLLISGNGNRWHAQGVGLWLKTLGIFGQRSHEKRLPPEVFQMSDTQIGLLLKHLWATDGSIVIRGAQSKGPPRVYFSTCSQALAGDVAALLLRLGIVARTKITIKKGYRPVYNVDVTGSPQQKLFLERVGAFGPRVQPAERLAAVLENIVANTNVDTLPQEVFGVVRAQMRQAGVSTRAMAVQRGTSYGGMAHFNFAPSRQVLSDYAEILDSDELRALCDETLFWDRIVAIEAAGEQEVFDLTVPGPASWLADGIVSHNSGALEQDADVITFVYRDEVYDPESPNKGVAEIIIGKHRNGQIGTVRLAFLNQYTRFEDLVYDQQMNYMPTDE